MASTTAAQATLAASLSAQVTAVPKLTTTFVPTVTTCTENRLTMLANREFEIWLNEPLPVPGTTFTDCYPSQFITSMLLSAGGYTQSAFQPLVCPVNYSVVGPYTSGYIACCPTGYSLDKPAATPFPDRPAFGAKCYTPIYKETPVSVAAYGLSSLTAMTTFSAPDEFAQAYAHPYEGFAFGVVLNPSIIPSASATVTNDASSSATAVSTASGAGATYTILADTDPVFTPSTLQANIGDTLVFQFMSGNHSVTQSSFESPCSPIVNGVDSGYLPNINNAIIPSPSFSFRVASTAPKWFYSKQDGDCTGGMTFALNPTVEQSAAKFAAAAVSSTPNNRSASKSNSVLSTGAKAGIAVGAIGLFAILACLAFFCMRKRRHNRVTQVEEPQVEYYSNEKPPTPVESTSYNNNNGYSNEKIETKPMVPPKEVEVHGYSTRAELPGYGPAELGGSDGYHHGYEGGTRYEPSPVSSGTDSAHPARTFYRDI